MAADRLGFATVFANDCCPKATRVYRERFGELALHEGDIRDLVAQAPPHDLLTAGFPCQPFSSAGKKQGIRDPRGTLFHSVVRVLQGRRPRTFVLENVKRLLTMDQGEHFAAILSALSGLDYSIEWRLLNAADFGLPQNRERLVIIGRRDDVDSRDLPPTPRLASRDDLLGSGFDPNAAQDRKQWKAIRRHASKFTNWGLARSGKFHGANTRRFVAGAPRGILASILEPKVSAAFDFTTSTRGRLLASRSVRRFVAGVEILSNQGGGARMGYTVFGTRGLAPTLTASASRHYERYRVGTRYRRLTNVEYARLQGFPDDHCAAVSVYDQYALFGAAVPPPLAEWSIARALSEGEKLPT